MAPRALSHFKNVLMAILSGLIASCTQAKKEEALLSPSLVKDTVSIPPDTVLASSPNLVLDNGTYYYNKQLFSGYVKGLYPNGKTHFIGGCHLGMQHGRSVSYYPNGKLKDLRAYRSNKSYGIQVGYWENGNQRFVFTYVDDKREGIQKQWYESGRPYAFLTFANDREFGMQQAWRENGKAYINYEVRDGIRYGLQKSALCYTLEKEKFK